MPVKRIIIGAFKIQLHVKQKIKKRVLMARRVGASKRVTMTTDNGYEPKCNAIRSK